jgi:hypothetical protein
LGCLSQELANEQQQFAVRTATGLALKNSLTARVIISSHKPVLMMINIR